MDTIFQTTRQIFLKLYMLIRIDCLLNISYHFNILRVSIQKSHGWKKGVLFSGRNAFLVSNSLHTVVTAIDKIFLATGQIFMKVGIQTKIHEMINSMINMGVA